MKYILGFWCLIACSISFAQPTKSPPKAMLTYGVSGIYLYEVSMLPYTTEYGVNEITPFFSILTTSLGVRKNVYNFSDQASVSLRVAPSLALINTLEGMYDMKIEVPLTLGYNWGAAATNKSISTRGYGFNAGINLVQAPFVNRFIDLGYGQAEMPMLLMYHASFHVRNWVTNGNADGICREVEVSMSITPKNEGISIFSFEGFRINTPVKFSVFFRRFMNY